MTDSPDNDLTVNDPSDDDKTPEATDDSEAIGSIDDMSPEPDETEEDEQAAALALLEQLRHEHRRIDQEITALTETGVSDMLKIKRMKKIKLSIKDQIAYLENLTTPDIIA